MMVEADMSMVRSNSADTGCGVTEAEEMTATISANPLGILIAFGAGIISFLSRASSPSSGLRLDVSGLSVASSRPIRPETGLWHLAARHRLFIAGFTVVFVSLGAAASGLGHLLGSHKELLSVVAGAFIIAFGAVLLITALPPRPGRVSVRQQRPRRHGRDGAPIPVEPARSGLGAR